MTYLLDTNVLWPLMGSGPDGEVGAWLAATPTNLLFTAAICQAEIFAGVRTMPQWRMRIAARDRAFREGLCRKRRPQFQSCGTR